MNIVFKNKDYKVDFISFLNPKMKILVFQDQIDYDLLFLGSKRKKNQRKQEHTKATYERLLQRFRSQYLHS